MKLNIFMEMRQNKFFKGAVYVAITIFLGAVGSGFWEMFLRDALIYFVNASLSAIVLIWSGYVEILHKNIGRSSDGMLVGPIFLATNFVVFATPWFLLSYLKKKIKRFDDRIQRAKGGVDSTSISHEVFVSNIKKQIRIIIPILAVTTMSALITGGQTLYAREAGLWATHSIEIISPYISAEMRVRLISDFRQIQSAKSFYDIRRELLSHANAAGVNLPKFSALGESAADD